jgi:hypothetical protein
VTDPLAHVSDTAKHWIDVLSLGALAATLMEWLPGASAVLVFVWTILRLFESWQNIQINRRKLRGE